MGYIYTMTNSSATKNEICNRFKRTENGLAIRLVQLGIIENKKVFFNRK